MDSTHPGDHYNEKIKIGQTSQFSAILSFMLKILVFLAPSTIFLKAPSSEINRFLGKLF